MDPGFRVRDFARMFDYHREMTTELSFKPIKRNLWTDFEELFGPKGACGGCWCMFWKLRGKAYDEARGFETRQMHKQQVSIPLQRLGPPKLLTSGSLAARKFPR